MKNSLEIIVSHEKSVGNPSDTNSSKDNFCKNLSEGSIAKNLIAMHQRVVGYNVFVLLNTIACITHHDIFPGE
jgi:hypothetical protein